MFRAYPASERSGEETDDFWELLNKCLGNSEGG